MATKTQELSDAAVEAGPGMPQLDFSTFSNQIFWLVVTLVVIYFILSRFALPRIGGALAERAGTITNDLAEAEDLKQRALEAEQAYEKALAEARAKAAKMSEVVDAMEEDPEEVVRKLMHNFNLPHVLREVAMRRQAIVNKKYSEAARRALDDAYRRVETAVTEN